MPLEKSSENSTPSSSSSSFEFKKEFPKLKKVLDEFIEKCSHKEEAEVLAYLANVGKSAASNLMASEIQERYQKKVDAWKEKNINKTDENTQKLLYLYEHATCLEKIFNRLDYHVMSEADWEIQFPPVSEESVGNDEEETTTEQDAKKRKLDISENQTTAATSSNINTLEFSCSYNGDNEGQGTYEWRCLKAWDRGEDCVELVLDETIRKQDKEVLERFAPLPKEDVESFLSTLFYTSFS